MTIRFSDPGGYDISNSDTTLFNGGFLSDKSFVGVTTTAPVGRFNTNAYSTSLSSAFFGFFLTASFQEVIFGVAFYNPFTTFTANKRFMSMEDGTTNQVDVATDATGHFFFRRNGTTIGGTSTNALTTGWHYFEMKAKIASGTSGSCELKVDGAVWLTVTGVNTQATGNASVNRFYIDSMGSIFQYYKDLYILDTGTGVRNGYLGDVKIMPLYSLAADGTFQQWAANTGTQVAAVQDGKTHTAPWPDDDTTYIFDTVAGHISAFQMDSVSATSIFAVSHLAYARTASSGTINQVLVQSGSVVETSATRTLTTTYKWYVDIQEQNPTGSVDWISSTVNSTHPGAKIQATSASARVSQELLLVMASSVAAVINSPSQLWIIT